MIVDLIIKNPNELLTMSLPNKIIRGRDYKNIPILKNTDIAIKNGIIIKIGKNLDKELKAKKIINCEGKTVLPSFVDCHTHLIFSGTREFELVNKINKTRGSNSEVMGGGIKYTVSCTRKSSKEELKNLAIKRLNRMLEEGITSIEAKSGYGLDWENEKKILEVIKEISHEIDIIPTFMGAHSIPDDLTPEKYTEILINEMIPNVKKYNLAKFCDVFCENGFFSNELAEKILISAKKNNLKLKIHVDQLSNTNGAELSAKLGVVSADHLDYSSEEGIKAMAKANVIGVLTPTITFRLDTKFPNVTFMMENNLPIALSTDFNPGAGYSESMYLVIYFACLKLKMLPIEALASATINAAYACNIGNKVGSIEVSKNADILIVDAPNHNYIPYHYGVNLTNMVIKNGKIVFSKKDSDIIECL
ncbi:MAG: imidazolonepropionase [Candidatus Sericytochromatia bacterium]|nr:MAG: imidazolonepropionase [Candidatus Sericytochromatia bacterium]